MLIKDLIVTGICKLIRNATIKELVVEAVNEVTKSEIDTLSGITGNVQSQINAVNSDLNTAQTEQTVFKSSVTDAINKIPRNPSTGLVVNSTLSQIITNLNRLEYGPDVSMVTATADKVLSGYKFVDKDWNVITGTIPDRGDFGVCDAGLFVQDNDIHGRIPYGYYSQYDDAGSVVIYKGDAVKYLMGVHGLNEDTIKTGVKFIGMTGTYTSDATALASDIAVGKTCYVNGNKVTGILKDHRYTPTKCDWVRMGNGRFEFAVTDGIYNCYYADGSYEYMEYKQVADVIGLTGNESKMSNTLSVLGVTGTLPEYKDGNHGHYSQIDGISIRLTGDEKGHPYVFIRYPEGIYRSISGAKYPGSWEATAKYSDLANAIGLTADKIVDDATLLGITGRVKSVDKYITDYVRNIDYKSRETPHYRPHIILYDSDSCDLMTKMNIQYSLFINNISSLLGTKGEYPVVSIIEEGAYSYNRSYSDGIETIIAGTPPIHPAFSASAPSICNGKMYNNLSSGNIYESSNNWHYGNIHVREISLEDIPVGIYSYSCELKVSWKTYSSSGVYDFIFIIY